MKLFNKLEELEKEMKQHEEMQDYWLNDEHYNLEKSEEYEELADITYKKVYEATKEIATKIVEITKFQVTFSIAMQMVQTKRETLKELLKNY